VIILSKPNFPPYVCISCGVADGRQWFVSLDLALDHYFNPLHAGAVFFCNLCWEDVATKVAKEAQIFMAGQEPWAVGEYVEPSYDNSKDVVKEVSFGPKSGSSDPVLTNPDFIPPIDSGSSEPSNPEPSTSDQPADNANLDESTEPVSEFREFFGSS